MMAVNSISHDPSPRTGGTLVLTRSEIASLMSLDEYISVVGDAFLSHAAGQTMESGLLHANAHDGEFHIKTGGIHVPGAYFAVKANGGFFQNRARHGLPNIQGLIVLFDARTGSPLAVMDSIEITIKRTGAATAVAAKYLARQSARSVTICGCGTQGRIQLASLTQVLPIDTVYAWDHRNEKAQQFADEARRAHGITATAIRELQEGSLQSDVIVTCTPSRKSFLDRAHVSPGSFIAAIGADSPDKQELSPELTANSQVVVDILEQCERVGELQHAIAAGLMSRSAVHATLGELVLGSRPGRSHDGEIFIYDATGTALQDVAAAAAVYERARSRNVGRWQYFGE